MLSQIGNKYTARKIRDSEVKRLSGSVGQVPESFLRQARKNAEERKKRIAEREKRKQKHHSNKDATLKIAINKRSFWNQFTISSMWLSWVNFWARVPSRLWNFFTDTLLIPHYRPEWGKYSTRHSFGSLETKKKSHEQDKDNCNDHESKGCQIISIVVSGRLFQTQLRTLARFPHTLLGSPHLRERYYDPFMGAYFIDRHPTAFESILYYYQSGGELYCPPSVAFSVLQEEIKFYRLGHGALNTFRESNGFFKDKETTLPPNLYQRKLWLFIDDPTSSRQSRFVAFVSIFAISLSIVVYCLETTYMLKVEEFRADVYDPVYFAETICILWFCIEFVLRVILCPDKLHFLQNPMNLIDFGAIVPYFLQLGLDYLQKDDARKGAMYLVTIRVIRLLRVIRVFKFSRHVRGLKILGRTLRASLGELGLLLFFFGVGVFLFSAFVYYAEVGEKETRFRSILDAFWWAIITMTTVGYGDILPTTFLSKIIAGVCAIAGVLVIGIPIPIIVSNFNFFCHNEFKKDKDNTLNDEQPVDTSCPHLPICRRLHHVQHNGQGLAWDEVHKATPFKYTKK